MRCWARNIPIRLASLNNLAGLYESQGRYSEAEPLYRLALEKRRAVLGEKHPDTLSSVNNLAGLYRAQGRYSEAEPLYRLALEKQAVRCWARNIPIRLAV